MKTAQIRKAKAIYLELAMKGSQVPSFAFCQRLKGRQKSEKALWWKTEKIQLCSD